ncbi:MAG: SMI1/KNR4 family protein [Ignavibacteriales bacterium]|nr:SMI1/KNR4 family protein [Ignavibacteriales bacterium]
MNIKDAHDFLDIKELEAFEKRINIQLPSEYREFILKHNGGKPVSNSFNFIDFDGKESNSLVHYFFSIHNEKSFDNLELTYEYYINEDRIPSYMLPIASDPFGNYICISTKEENYGKIYFCDHEMDTNDNLCFISNSFNEFLNMLK